MKPTPEQIEQELAALKRLVPFGPDRAMTREAIDCVVEELEFRFDDLAKAWTEISPLSREAVIHAREWKADSTRMSPSREWDGLAATRP
jgi:uncharacterized protein YciI